MALYTNIETTVVLTVVPTKEDKKMSKNNYDQITNQLSAILLPERIVVVNTLAKEWPEKLTITRDTKMKQIVQYLLKNNVDMDKFQLACDCIVALRPTEQPPMQVIKPVVGTENITVQETEKLIETLEQSLDTKTESTIETKPTDPYDGMSDEEAIEAICADVKKELNKDSASSSTPYWLAAGAAAIGAIAYGGYRVLTRTPSH